jgi:5'(3')-deoxyribonucleotidase
MNPLVLVDVDGVLADFIASFMDRYRFHLGIVPDGFVVDCWNAINTLPSRKAFDAAWNDSLLFRNPPAIPGSFEALERIVDVSTVYLVTALPFGHAPPRRAWLKTHAPFIPSDRIILATDKHMIRGDVLVEDRPANLFAWAAINPNGSGFLIRRPYNRPIGGVYEDWTDPVPENVTEVSGLENVADAIEVSEAIRKATRLR